MDLFKKYRKEGYRLKNAKKWQSILDSIDILQTYGYITDCQYIKMREKLYEKSFKDCEKN